MRPISCAILIAAALGGCDTAEQATYPAEPQAGQAATAQYDVVKLPSLGGAPSRGMAINDQGWVAGWSTRPDGTRHAVLWRDGSVRDLGTLGGPNSTVPWPGLNDKGTIVGIAQVGGTDPLDEDWSCELGLFLPATPNDICRGFVWQDGVMRELPTLGGQHGFATGVNNHGLVVGWAETPVHDPTCSPTATQVLQFRAVVWDPKNGSKGKVKVRELRPFQDDSTSAATAINDEGQAVGISGDCDQAVGRFSARHAVLWDNNGKPTEIPNLGGTSWHTPMDINARGDVVGFSNPDEPGDDAGEFIARAFLWINGSGTARDLRALPGDAFSEAFAINARGQVVGVSFGGLNGSRAFLWQDGALTNLNDLTDIGPDVLLSAQDINDAGQITGRVLDPATGETLAFVATPIGGRP